MAERTLGKANTELFRKISANVPASGDSLEDICDLVAKQSDVSKQKHTLLEALARLENLHCQELDAKDDTSLLDKLASNIAKSLELGLAENRIDSSTAEAASACLYQLSTAWSYRLDDNVLLLTTAYTDSNDPWTTEAGAYSSSTMLEQHLLGDRLTEFIVKTVLQGYLRPLFSKSTTKVTDSGRPNQFPDSASQRIGLEQAPWKAQQPRVISTFRWAVHSSNEALLREHWPLFTPVLLTIAEDEEAATRTDGVNILRNFLAKCPAKILQSTGIGMVFQEAMFPSLLYLPSLTPENESIKLVSAAYDALLVLAQREADPQSSSRRTLLDKMLRDGILTGYQHASEYIAVVEVLSMKAEAIINQLQMYSAKHVQVLLPVISSVMTDPFVMLHPTASLQANKALNALITNCWPRFSDGPHDAHIVRIISISWLQLHDSGVGSKPSAKDFQNLAHELKLTAKILDSIRKAHGKRTPAAMGNVLDREHLLRELFDTSDDA